MVTIYTFKAQLTYYIDKALNGYDYTLTSDIHITTILGIKMVLYQYRELGELQWQISTLN